MSIFRHEKPPLEESERRLGKRLVECLSEISETIPDEFEGKQYAVLADSLKKAARDLYALEQIARDLAWRTRLRRNDLNFKSGD